MPETFEMKALDIRLGDMGIVTGRQGVFTVCAGAECIENVEPCSPSAKAASAPSDVLTLTDGTTCRRAEFTPGHYATREQMIDAGWLRRRDA